MAKIFHWVPAYNMQCSAGIWPQAQVDGQEAMAAGHQIVSRSDHGCDLVRMRNSIMDELVRREDFDFLYMQDSDVYALANKGGPLMRLMDLAEETGAAMTGALVLLRTRPPRGNTHPCLPGEVAEVEKMGTGMVLIDLRQVREWYHDFTGPCFARSYEFEERDGIKHNRMAVADIGLDIWFCKVLRGHGQTIWCDGRIPTVHQDSTRTVVFDGTGNAFMDSPNAVSTAEPLGQVPGL